MIGLLQDGGVVGRIVADGLGIPLATAQDIGIGALHVVLLEDLVRIGVCGVGKLDGALHVLTDIEGTLPSVGIPPAQQGGIVGCLVANLPVELGDVVVDPPLTYPFEDVGIEVVVVLQSVGGAARGVAAHVAIDAERGHAELHPRLDAADGLEHVADEEVDILPAPVADAQSVTILGIGVAIGNGQSLNGIGIEVVVDVDAVDVVALHDVGHHLTDVLAILRHSGVEEPQPIVLEEAVGMLQEVGTGERGRTLRLGTERIDPGVQFHASLVALLHHPGQRVPIGFGHLALHTRQKAAPGFHVTLVEGIALGTHLEEDGVDARTLQFVKLVDEGYLHAVAPDAVPLIVDTLNPRSAKLALGLELGIGEVQEMRNRENEKQ